MSLFKPKEMKMYTKKDFDTKLPVGMIMIGANWCGHCQSLKPTWKQLYKETKGHTIAAIDAEKDKELVYMLGVSGYPTILIVGNNGKLKEYSGTRMLEDLKNKLPKLPTTKSKIKTRKNITKK